MFWALSQDFITPCERHVLKGRTLIQDALTTEPRGCGLCMTPEIKFKDASDHQMSFKSTHDPISQVTHNP